MSVFHEALRTGRVGVDELRPPKQRPGRPIRTIWYGGIRKQVQHRKRQEAEARNARAAQEQAAAIHG